ncbi:MAG: heavy metal-associated domain-containing protein [Bdellovibrionales bacterium]|jgi:copper chaperone CopZ|nr:heavy metal-associated domain-containing protein [Bdellovibrionales bacterium]
MIRFAQMLVVAALAIPGFAFADTTVDVKIKGMTCGSCVQRVSEELAKLDGIDKNSVQVELAGEHATLTVTKNDEKTLASIKNAVKKAGYEVAKIDVVSENKTKKN